MLKRIECDRKEILRWIQRHRELEKVLRMERKRKKGNKKKSVMDLGK